MPPATAAGPGTWGSSDSPTECPGVDPQIPIRSCSPSSNQRHPGRPQQTHVSRPSSLNIRTRKDRIQTCRFSDAQRRYGHGTNRPNHTVIPDPDWVKKDRTVLVSLHHHGQRALVGSGDVGGRVHRIPGPVDRLLCQSVIFCLESRLTVILPPRGMLSNPE